MRDLEKYFSECMAELDRLKIKYSNNVTVTINTRATSRLGLCKKLGDSYVIEISSVLLNERVDLKNGLKDTIMHELLHTCYGCMKHTGRWLALAEKVNAAYGYNIKRVAAPSEKIIPEELMPKAVYIVKCSRCGLEITRQKKSALITHPERYRCGKCKGKLIRIK